MVTNVSIEITTHQLFANGHKFGDTGAYERLDGWAKFQLDPKFPQNETIVDIDKAPTNSFGLVEFAAEVCILRPVNPDRNNGRLFFDYGNRGNKRALQYFNDAVPSNSPISLDHAGNGFLFRRGYSIVWGAWQGDLLPGSNRMTMCLPVAKTKEGPITGIVRTEFIANSPNEKTFPLSGWVSTRSHPTISLDTKDAQLTRRRYPSDQREDLPHESWHFARVEGGVGMDFQGAETSLIASDRHIHIPTGFEPGWIYELIYTGRDPLIMGLGHAAVRDLNSFLRYEKGDKNPLANQNIERAYCFGRSQTGRCIRDSIYRGFNADKNDRKVFDGVLNHVAGAGRMWLNHRFCNAVVPAGQQYEEHDNIADSFPFTYSETTDHLTGKIDAICKRPTSDPLIFHSQTGTEYWQRRGSLAHTDTKGNDLPDPENVRFYFWSSSQHVGDPRQGIPTRNVCQNLNNVVQTSMFFRAMLDSMDRWATYGAKPPQSQIPRRSDGTLVTMDEWRQQFPEIPGISIPHEPNQLPLYDFGNEVDRGILKIVPPNIQDIGGYAVLVPAVDKDGNDVAGIRAPMVAAPLATYTGWNLRGWPYGRGAMHEFSGSSIPLPQTESERRITGDSRSSIKKRYSDLNGYVTAIKNQAMKLIQSGYMLEEDLKPTLDLARNWSSPRHDIRL